MPLLFALALLCGSCSWLESAEDDAGGPTTVPVATLPTSEDGEDSVFVSGCNRRDIGEDSGLLLSAYGVVDGAIAEEPCIGEPNETVVQSWNDLVEVAPAELVAPVVVVAGYESNGDGTVAFAGPVDNDSEAFVIAIDIEASENDPAELRLTMAHELTHVFAQTTDQIDVAFGPDECDTFYNGFGCFQPDAYITAWVDTFWSPQQVADLPDGGQDEAGGETRCSLDPAFPGSYAASHPEEDFAEAFSAYVWDVDMPAEVQPRLDFFDQYPVLAEMRDNARALGLGPTENNFVNCG